MPVKETKSEKEDVSFDRHQLEKYIHRKFADTFAAIPTPQELLWFPFLPDSKEVSGKQLFIGTASKNGTERTVCAYVRNNNVKFRSGLHDFDDGDSRDDWRLDFPFNILPTGSRRLNNPPLESLVLCYFVISKNWDVFFDGGKGHPNVAGLAFAFSLIKKHLESNASELVNTPSEDDPLLQSIVSRPKDVAKLIRKDVFTDEKIADSEADNVALNQTHANLRKDLAKLRRELVVEREKAAKLRDLYVHVLENQHTMTTDERRILIQELKSGMMNI